MSVQRNEAQSTKNLLAREKAMRKQVGPKSQAMSPSPFRISRSNVESMVEHIEISDFVPEEILLELQHNGTKTKKSSWNYNSDDTLT